MKLRTLLSVSLIMSALSAPAAADTSLEFLYGRHFDEDFNGDNERYILTIKTFQPWSYGTFFMYYDITGPFTPASSDAVANERGGFFGGTSVTVSAKRIAEKIAGTEWDWGPLVDLSLRYELEHVSKVGALNYYGLQYDFKVPFFDFLSLTSVIRDDLAYEGVALQLGAAWQNSLSLGPADFVFAGFFSWGVTAEGKFKGEAPFEGRTFFLAQPQLLWDFGKTAQIAARKLYLGIEYQIATNRYLIPGKCEHVPQAMLKWNI